MNPRIPAHLQEFWQAYAAHRGGQEGLDDERFYEVCQFGDTPELVDELAQLVLAGRKRATADAVWFYEASGLGLPRPGLLSIVTNSQDRALCIIETLQVDLTPFEQVTAEFAATEGEGDGSLAFWRRAHREYFTRECERAGRVFSEDLLIACERFRVVWPLRFAG
ncbi:ASCH domain-containing protein [Paucibacter sp. B51]|uniref:ASCH domain-containing protein n=1 Tax=Paucibacter sp. B51 TaxID=2993315 RepID=UPI0022EBC452|nr:ASCH domain-containing protein [Paucibacter sp. B51]